MKDQERFIIIKIRIQKQIFSEHLLLQIKNFAQ